MAFFAVPGDAPNIASIMLSSYQGDRDAALRAAAMQQQASFHAGQLSQQAAALRQRAYEFDASRLPSQRDVFEQEMANQKQLQSYNLQAALHATQLTQAEQMRMARQQNALSDIDEAISNGTIDAQTANDLRAQIHLGYDPLARRHAAATVRAQEMGIQQQEQMQSRAAAFAHSQSITDQAARQRYLSSNGFFRARDPHNPDQFLDGVFYTNARGEIQRMEPPETPEDRAIRMQDAPLGFREYEGLRARIADQVRKSRRDSPNEIPMVAGTQTRMTETQQIQAALTQEGLHLPHADYLASRRPPQPIDLGNPDTFRTPAHAQTAAALSGAAANITRLPAEQQGPALQALQTYSRLYSRYGGNLNHRSVPVAQQRQAEQAFEALIPFISARTTPRAPAPSGQVVRQPTTGELITSPELLAERFQSGGERLLSGLRRLGQLGSDRFDEGWE